MARLTVDPMRLRQILLNLLSNACKFTKQGEVTLRVRKVVDGRDWVELAVVGYRHRHDGRAAGEAVRGILPGRCLDRASATAAPGLGLAITRKLARMMGGDVTVASEPGKGSVFTVRLPTVAIS